MIILLVSVMNNNEVSRYIMISLMSFDAVQKLWTARRIIMMSWKCAYEEIEYVGKGKEAASCKTCNLLTIGTDFFLLLCGEVEITCGCQKYLFSIFASILGFLHKGNCCSSIRLSCHTTKNCISHLRSLKKYTYSPQNVLVRALKLSF